MNQISQTFFVSCCFYTIIVYEAKQLTFNCVIFTYLAFVIILPSVPIETLRFILSNTLENFIGGF